MPLHIAPILYIAAGGALILAAGAVTVFILRRHRPNPLEKTVSAGIARHAKLYDGLYEGLCQILAREEVMDRDTLKEWCGRTARLENEPDFTAAFSQLFDSALNAPEEEYREKLKLLLKLISAAGVTRSQTGPIPYDASVRKSYLYLGVGDPVDGAVYNVIKPCWMFEGETVEQGVIMKGDQHGTT